MTVVPLRFFVVLVLLVTTSGLAHPAAAATAPITSVWTENSSVNVFQDTLPKTRASTAINLTMAKNEYEARIHRYQNYEQHYDPDSVVVATSVDNVNYTQKASFGKANGEDDLWYDLTFPASQARYLRLTFDKTGTQLADWLFLDEIEAYAPLASQQVNLAQGAGYLKSEAPDQAYPDTNGVESTDGVIAGHYSDGAGYGYLLNDSQTRSVTINLELPAPAELSLVKFAKYDDGIHKYAPDRVDIYTSLDGSSYQYRGSASWATGQWYEISFPHVTAGHIKIALTKTGDAASFSNWMFVDEIQIY